ncbi:MAG: acyltransferase family protein [Methanobrevibacter sp.]|jgi:fucose 4-O-acetylase-like acetyltransferase|nr:acyltransferase family protein [Methanobrevibacter sp.]
MTTEIATIKKSDSKTRLNKYDNLRGLGMILVVVGHLMIYLEFIEPTIGNMISLTALPLLFFVSGYLSKVESSSIVKLFKNLMIPYVIFTLIWIVFDYFILGYKFRSTPFLTEYTVLWYFFSLFIIRALLPALVKIRYIFWISLAFGLIIGLFPIRDNTILITKTVCLLPVFLLGYYIKNPESGPNIKKFVSFFDKIFKNKYIILIIFLITLGVLTAIFSQWDYQIFQFKTSYESLDLRIRDGILTRFVAIMSGVILIFLLYYLMPNKKTFLTKIGVNSFAIYIFHYYFVTLLNKISKKTMMGDQKIWEILHHDPILAFFVIVISWIAIVFILSRDVITKITLKLNGLFVKLLMRE